MREREKALKEHMVVEDLEEVFERGVEIMREREKALKEHMEKLAKGEFDYSFWKTAIFWQEQKS
ncbi:hypothetical protein ANCDUO_08390 [Ancylostoma duodenale]|uniref:Uncharacterized protein n=1 Tax=Ancylostoma duodenale TaxID=51022 RepID=A0A0C2CWM9_9BILA|nr:hypothetical protein ANCDUO_08390 [Ancylostoma duodenale]